MKNLNNFMNSCAIPNLFRRNPSARWILQYIPYNRLEQTAPSLIAGQLKSWKSAKSAKLDEKPKQLHEFLCNSQSVSTESKLSICSTIDPIQALWSNHSFLQRWSVEEHGSKHGLYKRDFCGGQWEVWLVTVNVFVSPKKRWPFS